MHRLLLLSSILLLSAGPALCNSSGEYPGKGDYAAWKQASDSSEDGVDYAAKGNYTMALVCYDEAIKIFPDDSLFYYNKANALRKLGKTKESLPPYKKAVELEPTFTSAWYNLANAQKDDKDLVAAEASFKQALKLDPKHMKAWFNLGEDLLSQRKLKEAKDAFVHAQEFATQEIDKRDIANYLTDIEQQITKSPPNY